MMKRPDESPAPHLNVYFSVDDVDATLNKATGAGASVVAPKTEIPA